MEIINIGSAREVFWDDYIVDTERTTARKRMHSPSRRELAISFDAPWEGGHCYFINMFRDCSIYRMYYHASNEGTPNGVRICYAESINGINWTKPKLGICEFKGSKENNIILDVGMTPNAEKTITDNFYVFKDMNPNCPKDELYKAISNCHHENKSELRCYLSPDGIHFRYGWDVYSRFTYFDSLNTAHYDKRIGKYRCFFRGWHNDELVCDCNASALSKCVTRDIRYMESEDFKNWSDPIQLNFGEGANDFQLYTNNVEPYYRADHILVGFPARYIDRYKWTDNYEKLCGKEERYARMTNKFTDRFGYTVTDCLFMCSRDGKKWYRPDEAFLRPGPENDWSWRYGDCFMNAGMFEYDTSFPNEDPELSFLVPTKRWTTENSGNLLYRYGMRIDGFISRYSDYANSTLLTKPFVFSGSKLTINFETSAAGNIYVELTDKNGRTLSEYRSCELFGNSVDREVTFEGNISALAGKAIRIRFTMSDADIYSFRFTE